MRDLYRKTGRTVRFEHSRGADSLVVVDESGESFFEDEAFFSRPRSDGDVPAEVDPAPCIELAELTLDSIPRRIECERLALSIGIAKHEFVGKTWHESTARLHVALVHRKAQVRITVDLGGNSAAAIHDSTVPLIAEKLSRLQHEPRDVRLVELSPLVTAQILRPLLSLAARTNATSNRTIRFRQRREPGRVDGNGQDVDECVVATVGARGCETSPSHNVYRPSYRSIPAVRPLHLDIEVDAIADEIECDATAIALSSEPTVYGNRLAIETLAANHASTFLLTIDLTVSEWLRWIGTIDDQRTWFPADAGTWGRRLAIRRT